MRIVLLSCYLLLSNTIAYAAPPSPPSISEDEAKQIAKGQVVIQHEQSGQAGRATAILWVEASPRRVLDEVMDLEKRQDESSVVTGVTRYRHDPSPEVIGATFTITVMGSNTVFHLLYQCRRDAGYCTFALDPSKKSDLISADGYYLVRPEGTGTMLFYASRSNTGRNVPGWIARWLAGSSLKGQVQAIRDRAEAK